MPSRVVAIHTAMTAIRIVGDAFREILPEVDLVNILDDSITPDAVKAGRIDQNIARRMLDHFCAAQTSGAAVILLCCSTVGETADIARALITTPIVRIDEAMAERAVAVGTRVGILATAESTLGPTSRLVQRKATEAGRQVELRTKLVGGAWEMVEKGDVQRHDQLVLEAIVQLAKEVDVVVLAQATIARILPQVGDVGVPVLSSPRLGVERVRQALRGK